MPLAGNLLDSGLPPEIWTYRVSGLIESSDTYGIDTMVELSANERETVLHTFHSRKAEVRGGSITHKKLASHSRRLDEQLKQPKSGQDNRSSLTSAQPVSPRSPTSPSLRVGTKV